MPIQTVEDMLADAKTQYHLLQTGNKARVVVDQNGERVEFTVANAAKLYMYIKSLENTLGLSRRFTPARVTL